MGCFFWIVVLLGVTGHACGVRIIVGCRGFGGFLCVVVPGVVRRFSVCMGSVVSVCGVCFCGRLDMGWNVGGVRIIRGVG